MRVFVSILLCVSCSAYAGSFSGSVVGVSDGDTITMVVRVLAREHL